MNYRASIAGLGAAIALLAGAGTAQAQDSTPAASRDTSTARKVRPDTVQARDTAVQGYRARLSGNCVNVAADTAAARAASRDTTARDTTARDTTAVAAISDSAAAQATRDSLAAIRSAEAVGVYRAPTPPRAADSTGVPCDSTGVRADSAGVAPDSGSTRVPADSSARPGNAAPPARSRNGGGLSSETTRD